MVFFSKKTTDTPRRRQQARGSGPSDSETNLDERYTFRRNRTLTGSMSSHVTTVNEASADLKSPRVKAHELHQKRRHIGGLLVATLVAAGLLFGLISQFTAGTTIHIAGIPSSADPLYEKSIQSYLTAHPIERFRFALNSIKLSEYVQATAPEVASVREGGGAGFGTTDFIIQMRQPVVGWTIQSHRQYVDATGTAFSRNYYQTPAVQVIDNSGVQVQAGQAIASNRFLGFVGRTVGLAGRQGYTVTQVVIPAGTTRQIEIHLEDIAYPIKMSVDRPTGEQIEDMAKAVSWFQQKKQTPQYIDIRVSGKAYYK